MSRRYRKKKSNNALPWVILAIVGLVFGIYMISKNMGEGSICGEGREADKENSGYCTTRSDDYSHLVIIVGNTQNSPMPDVDFTDGKLKDILTGVFYNSKRGSEPDVSIISAASSNDNIDFNETQAAQNITASNSNLMAMARSINKAIKNLPTKRGANYLGAIQKAQRLMEGADNTDKKAIIIIGSGYSDRGILDFAHNDLFNKSREIINIELRQDNNIVENGLSGTSIYWYNIGITVPPQEELDLHQETRNIYKLAFSYMGIEDKNIHFKELSQTKKYIGKSVFLDDIDENYSVEKVYVSQLKRGDSIKIDDTISRFQDYTAILENPDEVKNYMSTFVKYFKDTDYKLSVTGYIDRCTKDNVGLERAKVIKNLLVELGISSDRIKVNHEYGPPPKDYGVPYVCYDDPNIPNENQRTVRIVVE